MTEQGVLGPRLAVGALIAAIAVMATVASAARPPVPLFSQANMPNARVGDAPIAGARQVQINDRAFRQAPGSLVRFQLPNQVARDYEVVKSEQQGKLQTLSAKLVDSPVKMAVITRGPDGSYGRISTPEGIFLLRPGEGGDRLFRPDDVGLKAVPRSPLDAVRPPDSPVQRQRQRAPRADSPERRVTTESTGSGETTIDVLILYTPGLASRLGSNLDTRLNFLVDILNASLDNANVDADARLVAKEQVEYTDDSTLGDALDDLTNARDTTRGDLSNVPALRDNHWADLVTLIRDFTSEQNLCGLAWLNGGGAEEQINPDFDDQFGFNVVSDGSRPDGTFCTDLTFAHELGHNMGGAHQRSQSSTAGVFTYSYGYAYPAPDGDFSDEEIGTVMATGVSPDNEEMIFSNPRVTSCPDGVACGVPIGNEKEADVATSLNNVVGSVANFRDEDGDSDDDGIVNILDREPDTFSNACFGNGTDVIYDFESVTTGIIKTCAASSSVTLTSGTDLQDGGTLEVITPTTRIEAGFAVPAGADLRVITANPSP
jgi:hypothetical protein